MAGKSPPRLSSITFYKHKFKKALQLFAQSGGDPVAAYAKLKQQSANANQKFAKTALIFVVAGAAFIASLDTGGLEIKTTFFMFKIPTIYLLFICSFLWSSLCIAFIPVCQFISFLNAFRLYFGRFKHDYEMLVFLKDVQIDDFVSPPFHDGFLNPSKTSFYTRTIVFSIAVFAALLPVFASQAVVFEHAFKTIWNDSSVPLHKSMAIASVTLNLCSTLFAATIFFPFKTSKQTNLIRWVFLHPIHRSFSCHLHPQTDRWLNDSRRDSQKQ